MARILCVALAVLGIAGCESGETQKLRNIVKNKQDLYELREREWKASELKTREQCRNAIVATKLLMESGDDLEEAILRLEKRTGTSADYSATLTIIRKNREKLPEFIKNAEMMEDILKQQGRP